MQELTEGTTQFVTDSEERITAKMPVFYNPVMFRNRNLTLAVLLALQQKQEGRPDGKKTPLRIILPMEASGIRAARILHELVQPHHIAIGRLLVNDKSPRAMEIARQNVERYASTTGKDVTVYDQRDANLAMYASPPSHYVDIDPFGTPNPFLDAAVKRIVLGGILAITATDTSALAGTYPSATARKYWSVPSRTWLMHDAGLRILIRKVQLIALQHDIALVPVMSLATDHYYRVFFVRKSASVISSVLENHRHLHVCTACMMTTVADEDPRTCLTCGAEPKVAGPLWVGPLHNREFLQTVQGLLQKLDASVQEDLSPLLSSLLEEAKLDTAGIVGFLDVHELASRHKKPIPKMEIIMERLGNDACRTQFCAHGVKSLLTPQEIAKRIFL
jgi:tRNA (guanine26-N2/guanine27-N2)-dimethyltransferase